MDRNLQEVNEIFDVREKELSERTRDQLVAGVNWADIFTWPTHCIVCDLNFAEAHSPIFTGLDPEHTVAFCSETCFRSWNKFGSLLRLTQRFLRREDCIPKAARVD